MKEFGGLEVMSMMRKIRKERQGYRNDILALL